MAIRSRETVIGARAFLIGVILAMVIGVLSLFFGTKTSQIIFGVLALLGFLVGYFIAEKDIRTFLFASVSVVIVSSMGLEGIVLNAAIRGVEIQRVVTSVLGSLLVLFIPATIIVALKTVSSLAKS